MLVWGLFDFFLHCVTKNLKRVGCHSSAAGLFISCWNLPHTTYVFEIIVCSRSRAKGIRQYIRKKHFDIVSILNLSLFLCYFSINDQAPFINILLSTFCVGISAIQVGEIQMVSEGYCSVLCSCNFLGILFYIFQ